MLLARITDIGEDQVVECCANAWMGVADLLWPEVKDIACPWRDVANNSKVVDEGVKMAAACLKVGWVSQFAKVCIFGVLQKRFREVFDWGVSEIGSRG